MRAASLNAGLKLAVASTRLAWIVCAGVLVKLAVLLLTPLLDSLTVRMVLVPSKPFVDSLQDAFLFEAVVQSATVARELNVKPCEDRYPSSGQIAHNPVMSVSP